MRNLHLLRNLHFSSPVLDDIKKCYLVNESGISYATKCFLFSKDFEILLLNIVDDISMNSETISDLRTLCCIDSDTSVVGDNLVFNDFYAVLNNGSLVVVNIESKEVIIKTICSKIKYATWSPDYERTVIVTGNDQLLVLSIIGDDYETLNTVSLQKEIDEQNKFVNVGWGCAETQFRGTEGKITTTKHIEEAVEENLDDISVNICWKQNSSAFACSYLCHSEKIRKIKVFSCDGMLLNITKNITGLSSPIDWWPFRNLITVVQKLPNKKVISFIEENALKHGDFQIPNHYEILRISWNSSGSILALHGKEENNEFVSLWITSNYKWYQKQRLQFQECIFHIQWDMTVPNGLHVVLVNGIYRMYEWNFQINEYISNEGNNISHLLAVINQETVNFTPYNLMCQPPSIPHSTFTVHTHINEVIFPKLLSYDEPRFHPLILHCCDNRFLVTKYEELNFRELYYVNFGEANSEIEFSTPLEFSTWLWLLPNDLYFNWSRADGTYFCASHLDPESKSIVISKIVKMKSSIIAITNFELDVIVHTNDGRLFIYQNGEMHAMNFNLLEPCFSLQMLNSSTVIALSENKNLYVNEAITWRDIVSFYWKTPFLVLITMDSQLLITKVELTNQKVDFNEIQSRGIEPKSFLVTIVNDKVLIEMERGNLETISPRPFSIFQMEKMLKVEKYFEVFQMLRKQRINLNVIFDHDPEQFLKNIDDIVNKVRDPMYLTMFITELDYGNVAKTMFPWKYAHANDYHYDKVSIVCEKLVLSMKNLDISKLHSPLIAALVRLDKLAEAANYAIQYYDMRTLSHLTDLKNVYHSALLNFDLNCALKIAECSKLDPSEYLPFIHDLKETEINYRKFKICNHLEKYSHALEHLANCDDNEERFEEAVNYIHKHDLYNSALKVFSQKRTDRSSLPINDNRYLKIVIMTADRCYKKKAYEEAAVLYYKAGLDEKALECYLLTGNFSSAISALNAMQIENPEKETYQSLYNQLLQRDFFENAALVALHFLQDCEKTVFCFFSAKKYTCAINAVKSLNHVEYINEFIHPKVVTEAKIILKNIEIDMEHLNKQAERLSSVRQKVKNKELDADDDRLSIVSSVSSESGSVSSFGSQLSSASSSAKRLRRKERKLWNTKEGNPREGPSLLDMFKKDVQNKSYIYSEILEDLVRALVLCDEFELSAQLKNEYSRFYAQISNLCTKIWPIEEVTEEGGFRDIENRCPPQLNLNSMPFLKLF